MSVGIKLDIVGEKGLRRGMEALMHHLGEDLSPMFEAISEWWHGWQSEVLADEGAGLAKWQALRPKYAAWKAKHYPGRPLLELTGAMNRALTGGSGAFKRIKSKWMEVGTTGLPYVYAQNFGRPEINLPDRKFLGATKAAKVALDKAMQAELADVKRSILKAMGGPGGMAR